MSENDRLFVARYGDNLPDPETMCRGECEGTGVVPVWFPPGLHTPPISPTVGPTPEDYEKYYAAWLEAEQSHPADDGWHFVKCADCGGTGKRV